MQFLRCRPSVLLLGTLPSTRPYALSRFPTRTTAASRFRARPPAVSSRVQRREQQPSAEESVLWHTSQRPLTGSPDEGMRRLLFENDTLVIERQIEMLNIFVGFEQANRYSISDEAGNPLGFIAEESRSFWSVITRQAFATHRPFKAVIMDAEGSPIMWLRRPFAWINSRMFVQRLKEMNQYTPDGDPILETFGEAQQIWHPWRRRYEIFIRERPRRILSTVSAARPEPDPATFSQVAQIDAPFLAWDFHLFDAERKEIAYISRAFRGFGRELFTDTGRYFVQFRPSDVAIAAGHASSHRILTIDERALVLALAVNIDFDYFSRHSRGGGLGFTHIYPGD